MRRTTATEGQKISVFYLTNGCDFCDIPLKKFIRKANRRLDRFEVLYPTLYNRKSLNFSDSATVLTPRSL